MIDSLIEKSSYQLNVWLTNRVIESLINLIDNFFWWMKRKLLNKRIIKWSNDWTTNRQSDVLIDYIDVMFELNCPIIVTLSRQIC